MLNTAFVPRDEPVSFPIFNPLEVYSRKSVAVLAAFEAAALALAASVFACVALASALLAAVIACVASVLAYVALVMALAASVLACVALVLALSAAVFASSMDWFSSIRNPLALWVTSDLVA